MRRCLFLAALVFGLTACQSNAFAFHRHYYQSAATPAMSPLLFNLLLGVGDTLLQDLGRSQQPPATGLPPAKTLPSENPAITDLKLKVAAINAKVGNPPAENTPSPDKPIDPVPGDPKLPTNGLPDFYPR